LKAKCLHPRKYKYITLTTTSRGDANMQKNILFPYPDLIFSLKIPISVAPFKDPDWVVI
jgi:hypothetical protein